MPRVSAYHRPSSLEEALALLERDGAHVLGGGADLVGRLNTGELGDIEVVDLQSLGLSSIVSDAAGRVRLGAMASLQAVADTESLPGALRDLARAEEPSTLRGRATIGGVVAGRDPESVLLAGLLAADASVVLADASGERTVALATVLAEGVGRGVITAVVVATDGTWATSATRRTPADVPIVAVVGRRRPDRSVARAVTGVAATPIVVDADAADPASGLEPSADFRGSADYRRHLAAVHLARVLDALASN
ncbi:MAG TPA: FAD binding domain-containing protein [Propioniciclava tarda]|nr:FAD binding domain-containing protein [Propioniciclava tarda]HQA31645.1 FAD binding domain-containing protein [Propioniciclava tarda]HQD61397.1 FAD binding domain-containing protein [Propioniciclava tarda]